MRSKERFFAKNPHMRDIMVDNYFDGGVFGVEKKHEDFFSTFSGWNMYVIRLGY